MKLDTYRPGTKILAWTEARDTGRGKQKPGGWGGGAGGRGQGLAEERRTHCILQGTLEGCGEGREGELQGRPRQNALISRVL